MKNDVNITFSSIRSVMLEKLKTSCSQNSVIIFYIVDTGIDGNLMSHSKFETLFSRILK